MLSALWGVVNALDTPARQAMVPALVPADGVGSASALSGSVLLLGMVTGSALGAALVAAAGPTVAFAVNAASFLFDVALLATIRVTPVPPTGRCAGATPLRDGLDYVLRTPRLRNPLVALGILRTLAFTVPVSVPLLASEAFAGGPSAGRRGVHRRDGRRSGRRGRRGHPRCPGQRSLARAATLMAASMVGTAIAAPRFPCVLAGLTGIGFAWSLFVTSTVAIVQTAEPALLGRVMSWLAFVLVGGAAVGGPLVGVLVALAGPRAPFLLGAAAAVAAGVVAAPQPRSHVSRDRTSPRPEIAAVTSSSGVSATSRTRPGSSAPSGSRVAACESSSETGM